MGTGAFVVQASAAVAAAVATMDEAVVTVEGKNDIGDEQEVAYII